MEGIIQTKNLTKRYGDKVAVNRLELSIEEGEVFGLLGPNGAGKTTTILMLLGLTEPYEGVAMIQGINCTRHPVGVKKIVGYLPDNVGFYPDMTGRENLRFTGRLNGLSGAALEERIDRLLERVGMTRDADRKTSGYSKGMKQRLGIADVLMKDPKIIIMDEPTLGIDPEGMRELLELISQLSKVDGRTVLISSHQLYQVQQICDRVGIFVGGSLVACGRIEELGRQVEKEDSCILELKTLPQDDDVAQIIGQMEGVESIETENERMIIRSGRDIRADVTASLGRNGYTIQHLHQRGSDLDEIYHRYFEKAGQMDENIGTKKKNGKRRFLFAGKNKTVPKAETAKQDTGV